MDALGTICFEENKEFDAYEWFKKAADKGFTRSINSLGICYEHGIGVEKNWNEAIKLYEEAAEKGHIQSIFNLGYLYMKTAYQQTQAKDSTHL